MRVPVTATASLPSTFQAPPAQHPVSLEPSSRDSPSSPGQGRRIPVGGGSSCEHLLDASNLSEAASCGGGSAVSNPSYIHGCGGTEVDSAIVFGEVVLSGDPNILGNSNSSSSNNKSLIYQQQLQQSSYCESNNSFIVHNFNQQCKAPRTVTQIIPGGGKAELSLLSANQHLASPLLAHLHLDNRTPPSSAPHLKTQFLPPLPLRAFSSMDFLTPVGNGSVADTATSYCSSPTANIINGAFDDYPDSAATDCGASSTVSSTSMGSSVVNPLRPTCNDNNSTIDVNSAVNMVGGMDHVDGSAKLFSSSLNNSNQMGSVPYQPSASPAIAIGRDGVIIGGYLPAASADADLHNPIIATANPATTSSSVYSDNGSSNEDGANSSRGESSSLSSGVGGSNVSGDATTISSSKSDTNSSLISNSSSTMMAGDDAPASEECARIGEVLRSSMDMNVSNGADSVIVDDCSVNGDEDNETDDSQKGKGDFADPEELACAGMSRLEDGAERTISVISDYGSAASTSSDYNNRAKEASDEYTIDGKVVAEPGVSLAPSDLVASKSAHSSANEGNVAGNNNDSNKDRRSKLGANNGKDKPNSHTDSNNNTHSNNSAGDLNRVSSRGGGSGGKHRKFNKYSSNSNSPTSGGGGKFNRNGGTGSYGSTVGYDPGNTAADKSGGWPSVIGSGVSMGNRENASIGIGGCFNNNNNVCTSSSPSLVMDKLNCVPHQLGSGGMELSNGSIGVGLGGYGDFTIDQVHEGPVGNVFYGSSSGFSGLTAVGEGALSDCHFGHYPQTSTGYFAGTRSEGGVVGGASISDSGGNFYANSSIASHGFPDLGANSTRGPPQHPPTVVNGIGSHSNVPMPPGGPIGRGPAPPALSGGSPINRASRFHQQQHFQQHQLSPSPSNPIHPAVSVGPSLDGMIMASVSSAVSMSPSHQPPNYSHSPVPSGAHGSATHQSPTVPLGPGSSAASRSSSFSSSQFDFSTNPNFSSHSQSHNSGQPPQQQQQQNSLPYSAHRIHYPPLGNASFNEGSHQQSVATGGSCTSGGPVGGNSGIPPPNVVHPHPLQHSAHPHSSYPLSAAHPAPSQPHSSMGGGNSGSPSTHVSASTGYGSSSASGGIGGSRFSPSPNHSRGSSPLNCPPPPTGGGGGGGGSGGHPGGGYPPPGGGHGGGNGGSGPPNNGFGNGPGGPGSVGPTTGYPTVGQHAVYVHVNPGETLSVRVNNEIQHIPGPATVRMVSQNPGLPAPLPLHVPPGHIVQQIVDENGVLRHLILSPQQPQGPPLPPSVGAGYPHQTSYSAQQQTGAVSSAGAMNNTNNLQSAGLKSAGNGSNGSAGGPMVNGAPAAGNGDMMAPPLGSSPSAGLLSRNPNYHRSQSDAPGCPQQAISSNNSGYSPPPGGPIGVAGGYGGSPGGFAGRPHPIHNHPHGPPIQHGYPGPAAAGHVHAAAEGGVLHHPHHQNASAHSQQQFHPGMGSGGSGAVPPHHHSYSHHAHPGGGAGAPGGPHLHQHPLSQQIPHGGNGMFPSQNGPTSGMNMLPGGRGGSGYASNSLSSNSNHLSTSPYPQGHPQHGGPSHHHHSNAQHIIYDDPRFSHSMGGEELSNGENDKLLISGEDENAKLVELLSRIQPPRVCQIEPREALLQWQALSGCTEASEGSFPEIEASEFTYEVLVSEGSQSGKYTCVYYGNDTFNKLHDLKPATEYFVKLSALLHEYKLQGSPTTPVSFLTKSCRPDKPTKPRLLSRSKTVISLKWTAAIPNGSPISVYRLESDQGRGGEDSWTEVYAGTDKQHKLTKLNPATNYRFRLFAENANGISEYSDIVCAGTSGQAPSAPDTPKFRSKSAQSIELAWKRRAEDEEFTLQMEDPESGYGFQTVYTGSEPSWCQSSLEPNKAYYFRLAVGNVDGVSAFSEPVSFTTDPERPGPPGKPFTRGRPHTTSVKLAWDPPKNTGGGEIQSYILERGGPSARPPAPNESGGRVGWSRVYAGDHLETNVTGLEPGQTYHFRASCSSLGGQSGFSDMLTVTTQPVAPGACRPPTLHSKPKSNSLHIKWGPPEKSGGSDITSYEVQMASIGPTPAVSRANSESGSESGASTPAGPASVAEDVYRMVYQGTKTDCVVGAGLGAGQWYAFRVRALNKSGPSAWSDTLEVATAPTAPDCPRDVLCTARSPTSIAVSWTEPAADNGSVVIEYRLQQATKRVVSLEVPGSDSTGPAGSGDPHLVESDGNGLSERVEIGAGDGAATNRGSGSSSLSSSIHSSPARSQPAARLAKSAANGPYAASAAGVARSSINEESQGGDLDYTDWSTVYSGHGCATELRNLSPATKYAFRVLAVNAAGSSGFSESATCETPPAPPGPVPGVHTEVLSTSEITVIWDEPDDNGSAITGYHLDVNPPPALNPGHGGRADGDASESSPAQLRVPAHTTQHTIMDLSPETTYRIRVRAVNENGAGPYSASAKTATFSLPPPPPSLELVMAGHNSLKLKWSNPQPGSDQLSYSLEIENKSGSFSPVYEGANHAHKVPRLSECTTYKFRIRASSPTGGIGVWSEVYSFSTGRAPPPAIKGTPRITESSEKCCRIEWSASKIPGLSAGDKVLYQVQLQSARSSSEDFKMIYQGPDTSYSMSGLSAGATYRVRVCLVRVSANGEETFGPFSTPTSFSTPSSQLVKSGEVKESLAALGAGMDGGLEEEVGGRSETKIVIAILAGFSIVALLVAFLLQTFIM